MALKIKNNIPDLGAKLNVGGAPDGVQYLMLAELARARGEVLHVVRDDRRLDAAAEGLAFFAPDIAVLRFPAWDCLPYDRVSPNPEIAAERAATLCALADGERRGPRLVIATANAVLQRVPVAAEMARGRRRLTKGERIDVDALIGFLAESGYARVGTVAEPGEFGVRGGLIDIFPPGAAEPLRLDLFGDTLEAVRTFDPVTQRTTGQRADVDLEPPSEFRLEPAAIARFRAAYTALFGVPSADDALYAAVCAGRRHAGMEHWLPLFHENLATVFDYAPAATVTLDPMIDDARESRLDMIADYYEARRARESGPASGGSIYRPLPPDRLYLSRVEWNGRLDAAAVVQFSTFALPAAADVVDAGGRDGRDFAPERAHPTTNLFDAVRDYVAAQHGEGRRVVLACYSEGSRDRLAKLLAEHGIAKLEPVPNWGGALAAAADRIPLAVVALEKGFATADLAVLTEQDILGDRIGRPPKRARRAENFIAEVTDLAPGDLVIHVDHGVGRFVGLQTIEVMYAPHDCLLLNYEGGDRLFVPVENIEMLSRYGSEDAAASLDRLGGAAWQARKARVKKRLKDMAEELIRIAAQRTVNATPPLAVPTGLYEEFCARFPYHETDDQRQAISDVLADLNAGKPMDRLVCGDVGFGKTEVALRSAFVVAMSGRQVAVVCPTTLLARQHYATFTQRFEGLPVKVAHLSRLVNAKNAAAVKLGLADGSIDIVIGTHAILAAQIAFRDLGMVVIDEEQHFGVKHKERLKQFRANIHVLTLTATPIPRTMQLALSGVRELSLIATPPVDRLAVRTYILPFDPVVVREAIQRERFRGGQIYYVAPRIADLPEVEDFLKRELPEVKFSVIHGRLPPTELDGTMNAFYDGGFDVLICTNIIESGLDIPSVNTLIIHRADMFGLAQLYQIRGRVGRSKVRAYAYLTLPATRAPGAAALKRLEVMQALDGLGAGFSLASHDLDLRGAGNLLGEEQSGHIREVGLELYQQMLEEAVATAKAAPRTAATDDAEAWSPQIQIGTSVLIPESYIGDLTLRMGLYRRLARLTSRAEIEGFAAELIDRFGPLPDEVEHLVKIVGIKQACLQASIERIEAGPKGATIAFRGNRFANPAGLVDMISRQSGAMKLRPDHRLVYLRAWDNVDERLKGIFQLVDRLAAISAAGKPAGVAQVVA